MISLRQLGFRLALPGLVMALATGCTPAEVIPQEEPVIIWVSGAEPGEPTPAIGLYRNYAIEAAGMGFSRRNLASLETATLTARFPLNGPQQRFEGPALSTVLAAAGRPGAGARLTALDGYQIEISASMIADHTPLLAISRDAAPLATGGYGPSMLVWPRDDDPRLSTMNDDLWIWGVFVIEAIDPAAE
ncbi:MAG: hypothetical protein AAFX09_05545 [Pseudomonadota bacterium]